MDDSKIYPGMISFPYPSPGTKNPKTDLYFVDLSEVLSGEIDAENFQGMRTPLVPTEVVQSWDSTNPEEDKFKGYYLNIARWADSQNFEAQFKNRNENYAITNYCDKKGVCRTNYGLAQFNSKGWIGNHKPSHQINGKSSSEVFTVESDDMLGINYLSLVRIDTETGERDWRTVGQFEVSDAGSGYESVHCYDEVNDLVYFTSTEDPANPGQELPRIRHLWSTKGRGEDKSRTCLTQYLDTEYEPTINRCRYIDPSFSPDCSGVIINCLGTGNKAPVTLTSVVNLESGDLERDSIDVLVNNEKLTENLEENFYYRNKIYGTFNLTDDTDLYYYSMYLPPKFDASKTYPMLMEVYAGPGHSWVQDSYSRRWDFEYIASTYNVIVANFDGRGSGFRGNDIMWKNYLNLGHYEPEDQIEFAKRIADQVYFVDPERIMIWGRSYGGYTTSRIMAKDSEGVFKCGAIVAPVTDWKYYSTIYSERYLQTPTENQLGYDVSKTIQNYTVENFNKHKDVFIVHGTADDNVHFINSASLSKFLIREGAETLNVNYFAADENHGFSLQPGSIGYYRHYNLMTRLAEDCLDLTRVEDDEVEEEPKVRRGRSVKDRDIIRTKTKRELRNEYHMNKNGPGL